MLVLAFSLSDIPPEAWACLSTFLLVVGPIIGHWIGSRNGAASEAKFDAVVSRVDTAAEKLRAGETPAQVAAETLTAIATDHGIPSLLHPEVQQALGTPPAATPPTATKLPGA